MKGFSSQGLIALVLSLSKSLQRLRMCKWEAASGALGIGHSGAVCVIGSYLGPKSISSGSWNLKVQPKSIEVHDFIWLWDGC